jgi:DNA-binding PadR family transcriptional regulator
MGKTSRNAASDQSSAKDPYLPALHRIGDIIAPTAPQSVKAAALQDRVLSDLSLKLAYTVSRFTTDWVAKQLHLSMPLADELLYYLSAEGLIQEVLKSGPGMITYSITPQGREAAERLLEVCRYIGPAPVHLNAYTAMLRWQFANTPPVKPEHLSAALSRLVISDHAAKLAGLAVSSGRSLFVFGPPGNGKSSLGRQIRSALSGDYWIPYCLSVGESVIRLFDDQSHERVEVSDPSGTIDQRWVRIRRPLVIVGGELTLELLDLVYIPTLRSYEAPPHLKANGGVFLVDDFGRERISPDQLLNRFITPMEYQVDYFTLCTGQKIQLPLRHVLVIATNLSPELVTDPAFLRRIGYRVYLGAPSPAEYARIFQLYAQQQKVAVPAGLIEWLLERYRTQQKELRACEPRDLIERSRDICRYQNRPLELSPEVLDLAWVGYFGGDPSEAPKEGGNGKETNAEVHVERPKLKPMVPRSS